MQIEKKYFFNNDLLVDYLKISCIIALKFYLSIRKLIVKNFLKMTFTLISIFAETSSCPGRRTLIVTPNGSVYKEIIK
jgi:hypothetical protein